MVQKILIGLLIFLFSISVCEAANLSGKTEIKDLRYSLGSGTLRIVLDISKQIDFTESYAENPSRLIVTLKNSWIDVKKMKRDIELVSTVAKRIKVAQFDDSTVRLVVETMADVKIFWLNGGSAGKRLVVDIGNADYKPNEELNQKQQDSEKISESDADRKKEEKERKEREKQEKERLEKERKEQEKLEKERLEKERKEQEKQEKELREQEKKEKERLEKERKEQEKHEKELKEKEKKEKERLEKERKEKEKKNKERDKKNKDKNKDTELDEPFRELEDDLDKILTLEGKIICIDPGHGGADSGAIGPTGVMEKSVTLRVALKLQEMLEAEGAEVIMTRTTDKPVSYKGDKASAIEELQARCDVANRAKATIFISIHADSFTNPNARGSTGYYYSKTEGTSAKRLADAVRRGICEQLKTPSRGTQPCNFYVVRHTDMAATLIELAFISNKDEEQLLDSEEGIEKAAQGIFDGIEDYFG